MSSKVMRLLERFNDNLPQGMKVISAKWVFTWNTDSNRCITKAKARLVAVCFGQQSGA